VRRGDVLASRTWADIGITLAPQAVSGFPGWVAPLSANGVAAIGSSWNTCCGPLLAAPGVTEYTVEIDGQQLRYRNTPPVWVNMVHPGPQGSSGVKISAVTFDGRTVELFSEPGQFGLEKMIGAAEKKRLGAGLAELRWSAANVSVGITLKVVSNAGAGAGDTHQAGRGFNGLRLPDAIVGRAMAPPAVAATAAAIAAAGAVPVPNIPGAAQ
jgi:type VI secretion system protein ImpL